MITRIRTMAQTFQILLLLLGLETIPMTVSSSEIVLFPFHSSEEIPWRSIDDQVMGGVSQSRFVLDPEGWATFEGHVSLANNGGFASVRSTPQTFQIKDTQGLRFRVRGDGKSYKITLKTDRQFDGILYQYAFETKKEEWIEIVAPFDQFIPRYRGREVSQVPRLNPEEIRTFGFMISDQQSGPFQLKIDWIHATSEIDKTISRRDSSDGGSDE